jgi:hypothetical protein
VIEMRSSYRAIKGAMLGGMIMVLSASPALAFGDKKVLDENPMKEINKVEKCIKMETGSTHDTGGAAEKAMLKDKKADENLIMKKETSSDLGVILGEGILDEGILGLEE